MSDLVFQCCEKQPKFFITYSVGGENKKYEVCESCSKLECFQKYAIKKDPIYPRVKRFLDNSDDS